MGKIFMQPMGIPPALIVGWDETLTKVRSAPLPLDLEIPFEIITLLLIVCCVPDVALDLGGSVKD